MGFYETLGGLLARYFVRAGGLGRPFLFKWGVLGSCPGGMRGRNGRACRVQIIPRQNTLKRGLRTVVALLLVVVP